MKKLCATYSGVWDWSVLEKSGGSRSRALEIPYPKIGRLIVSRLCLIGRYMRPIFLRVTIPPHFMGSGRILKRCLEFHDYLGHGLLLPGVALGGLLLWNWLPSSVVLEVHLSLRGRSYVKASRGTVVRFPSRRLLYNQSVRCIILPVLCYKSSFYSHLLLLGQCL